MHIVNCLQQPGKHNVSLLLVLVTKVLAVSSLFLLAPGEHIEGADRDEQCDGWTPADEDHTDPGKNFVHVVRAGHDSETVTIGDLSLSTARAPQARQIVVHQEVARLAKEEQRKAQSVNREGGRLRGRTERCVHLSRSQRPRNCPVEKRVSEDVPYGHGRGRELVYKGGLQLSLDEVCHDAAEGELLAQAQRAIKGIGLWHEVLDERIDGRVEIAS